jgi:SAM-dependent methyltransferase
MPMTDKNEKLYYPCAVCGESRPQMFRIWFDDYLKLYRCKSCGFVSQYPGPGSYNVVTDYKDKYSLDFLKAGQEFMYPMRRVVLQDIVNRITKYQAVGNILDVGCGDGHFLYLSSKKGFSCYGVEGSEKLSKYASSKSGAKVIQGLYNKEMFPENSFDVISLIQVLEHIPTPINALETAKYHLRPNGILVIEIPSIYAPNFIAYRLTRIKKFVKPPSGVIFSHFGYYNPKSLFALTQKCGFNNEELVTGRWKYKYSGYLKIIGQIFDPVFNYTKIGGILYIGRNSE